MVIGYGRRGDPVVTANGKIVILDVYNKRQKPEIGDYVWFRIKRAIKENVLFGKLLRVCDSVVDIVTYKDDILFNIAPSFLTKKERLPPKTTDLVKHKAFYLSALPKCVQSDLHIMLSVQGLVPYCEYSDPDSQIWAFYFWKECEDKLDIAWNELYKRYQKKSPR